MHKTPWIEWSSFLYGFASMGASLSQNSILCSVSSLSLQFGEDFFAQVVFAVLFPHLIMAVVQGTCDARTNRYFGEARMNFLRLLSGFLLNIVTMLCFPLVSDSRGGILVLSYISGFLSAGLFGTLQQIAMSSENRQAMFAFGNQVSGLIIFVLARLTGFHENAHYQERVQFFVGIALLELACLLSLLMFNTSIPLVTASSVVVIHEEEEEESFLPLPAVKVTPQSFLSTSDGRYVSFSLFITAASSAGILPYFAYFQSPTEGNLSQELFFLRLLCDAISRPATIYSTLLREPQALTLLSILRVVLFVPFLLYLALVPVELNSSQTRLVQFLVGLFAFTGGFIGTRCYQIALLASHPMHRAQVAASLSIFYSCAAVIPVMMSLLRHYQMM
jgi:hypothetical protein